MNASQAEQLLARRRLSAGPEYTGELVTSLEAVLRRKGDTVFSVPGSASVLEAVRLMNVLDIGSLLVAEGRELIGILSDRDVLNRVVAERRPPESVRVAEVMSELPSVSRRTTVAEAMWLMTHRRRRHLPVCDDDGHEVIGVVSIGDLTKWLIEDKEARIVDLLSYITRP